MKVRVVKHGDVYTVERRRGWGLFSWWQLYQTTDSLDQACIYFNHLKKLDGSSKPKPILIHYP